MVSSTKCKGLGEWGTELQGQLGMETQGSEGNNYGSKWGRRVLIHTT